MELTWPEIASRQRRAILRAVDSDRHDFEQVQTPARLTRGGRRDFAIVADRSSKEYNETKRGH